MKRYFLPLLLATVVLAILFPIGEHLKPILPFLLATLLFFNFYSINFERENFYQWEILFYLLLVLLIMPGIVFVATRSFSFPFRVGIFLITITPAAISSPIVIRVLGGNMELAVANTVLYNLLAPLSYTVLTKVYFQQSGLHVPVKNILIKLCLLVGIPFVLALVIKRIPRLAPPLRKISAYINILFLLMVFTAISSSAGRIRAVPKSELLFVFLATLLIALSFYSGGLLLGRSQASKKALTVNMGQKNASLCIWLALSNFDPLTAIPAAVYIIIHHFLNSLLIFIFSRKKGRE